LIANLNEGGVAKVALPLFRVETEGLPVTDGMGKRLLSKEDFRLRFHDRLEDNCLK